VAVAELDSIVARTRQHLESAIPGPDGLVANDPTLFDIRVSLAMVEEACALLTSLLDKLDGSGLDLNCEGDETTIAVDDILVPVRMREEVNRLPTQVGGDSNSPWRHKQLVLEPCGELSLTVFAPAGRRYTWAGSSVDISADLDELVLRVLSTAAHRRRLNQSFDPRQDSDKIRELEATVGQWRRAQRIREFVAAARSAAHTDAEWLEWAAAYADSIDPLHGDR
jgi:hypothetical protein